jgi:hypothetical protein
VPMRFFLHVFDDTVRQTNSKNKCNCYYGFLIPVKFSVMDGWMDGWTDRQIVIVVGSLCFLWV